MSKKENEISDEKSSSIERRREAAQEDPLGSADGADFAGGSSRCGIAAIS